MKRSFRLIQEAIFNAIGVGRENAAARKALAKAGAYTDREARKALEELRSRYAILNLSDGKGYFLPEFTEEGLRQAKQYKQMQLARMKSIKKSLRGTEKFLKEARKRLMINGQISLFDWMGGDDRSA